MRINTIKATALPTFLIGADMSNQTNDKQVILAVAGALLLLSYAYYIGAYWLVLGGA